MSEIDSVVDRFFEARATIFAHVGYVEKWRVLPIDDSRDQFWAVDATEREWVKFSPKREALMYWLEDHDAERGPYGDVLFENEIYTQRHLPKWVYRGKQLTLVVANTDTDGNMYLQLFRNENEIRPDSAVDMPKVFGDAILLPAIAGTACDPQRVCVACKGRSFQIKSDGPNQAWLKCMECGKRQPSGIPETGVLT